MQEVIIMVAPPGSGKSTYSKETYPYHVILCQDVLGSRLEVERAMAEALEAGKSIVIDRCNVTKLQRRPFVNLALQYGVDKLKAVHLVVPDEECVARVIARRGHPTIETEMTNEKKRMIVYQFFKDLERPDIMDEGFNEILTIKNY